MHELIDILHQDGYSLVLRNKGIHTFTRRGIADLYDLLQTTPDLLRGASIADKVVGKGAAALMILGHVKSLYADIISHAALQLLQNSPVQVQYGTQVAHIENRTRTGFCPVETLCADCATAEECLPLIKTFIESHLS